MYGATSFSQVLARLDFREIKERETGEGRSPALNCLDIPSRQAESFYIEAIKLSMVRGGLLTFIRVKLATTFTYQPAFIHLQASLFGCGVPLSYQRIV
jgi:hypothetical protein